MPPKQLWPIERCTPEELWRSAGLSGIVVRCGRHGLDLFVQHIPEMQLDSDLENMEAKSTCWTCCVPQTILEWFLQRCPTIFMLKEDAGMGEYCFHEGNIYIDGLIQSLTAEYCPGQQHCLYQLDLFPYCNCRYTKYTQLTIDILWKNVISDQIAFFHGSVVQFWCWSAHCAQFRHF